MDASVAKAIRSHFAIIGLPEMKVSDYSPKVEAYPSGYYSRRRVMANGVAAHAVFFAGDVLDTYIGPGAAETAARSAKWLNLGVVTYDWTRPVSSRIVAKGC